jgi:hypothetical protein
MLGYRDVIDIKDIYAKHFSIESPDRIYRRKKAHQHMVNVLHLQFHILDCIIFCISIFCSIIAGVMSIPVIWNVLLAVASYMDTTYLQ